MNPMQYVNQADPVARRMLEYEALYSACDRTDAYFITRVSPGQPFDLWHFPNAGKPEPTPRVFYDFSEAVKWIGEVISHAFAFDWIRHSAVGWGVGTKLILNAAECRHFAEMSREHFALIPDRSEGPDLGASPTAGEFEVVGRHDLDGNTNLPSTCWLIEEKRTGRTFYFWSGQDCVAGA